MAWIIEGETGDWELVCGLEVHGQVISQAKLFSGAATAFGASPNSQVSLVDSAMPGMLPVINEYCIEQAVRTGLGLKAQINLYNVFERKNYFYADLPQGYQISQFKHPIVGEGTDHPRYEGRHVPRQSVSNACTWSIDAGKSHARSAPQQRSFIDLNRVGRLR